MPHSRRDVIRGARRLRRVSAAMTASQALAPAHFAAAVAEAREAGLFDAEKTVEVRFRAPEALVDAAMIASRAGSEDDMALMALAVLAQSDPVITFLRTSRGALGEDHHLEN